MTATMTTEHPLEAFFNPSSVAIIGASSDPNKLGGKPIRYLLQAGFSGRIYPINKRSDTIQGLQAYATLSDIPEPVDQALIIVPAAAAIGALQDCIDKGIKAVQVLSSGFAEESEEGARQQQQMMEMARAHGVRLLGPNCLGIVSVRNRYFATFSTALEALSPKAGGISFATQSGAFGSCAYAQAIQRGLGIARIVATGNEADVDVTECIDFLATDNETQVICAAIEGCRDGSRLRRALSKAAQANKTVVLMKVGSSAVGQRAAETHTGAIAGDDKIFDVVCREHGAWRAHSIEEMLDIAYLCTQLPLPANERANIITVSGGIGVLMADDAERFGVDTPPVSNEVLTRLKEIVPFLVGTNPLDTTAQIGAIKGGISRLVERVMQATDCATQFIYLAQIPCDAKRFLPLLAELSILRAHYPDRLMILVGPSDDEMRRRLEAEGFVIFSDPSRAVRALGALCEMGRRRGKLRHVSSKLQPARSEPRVDLPAGMSALNEPEAKQLLEKYGLPVPREVLCSTEAQAVDAAERTGYPVVAKIVSPDIQHKTEFGGVILNLHDADSVRAAFNDLMRKAKAQPGSPTVHGVLIAPMIKGGVETILGVHVDPVFGPMIMFGLGGVAVELYKDVAFASAPLSAEAAGGLIDTVKAAALLKGWRGGPPADIAALQQALMALSDFASDWAHRLAGVDINPFVVLDSGAFCLDAVVSLRGTA